MLVPFGVHMKPSLHDWYEREGTMYVAVHARVFAKWHPLSFVEDFSRNYIGKVSSSKRQSDQSNINMVVVHKIRRILESNGHVTRFQTWALKTVRIGFEVNLN